VSKKIKITKRVVDALKPVGGSDVFLWDNEIPGFGVRVKPSGSKSFVFQFRGKDRRQGRTTIGRCATMPAESARDEAKRLAHEVALGRNPSAELRQERTAETVKDLGAYYLGPYAKQNANSEQHVFDSERVLERFVYPKFGSRKAKSLTPQEVRALHASLSDTPAQANRTLRVLRAMYGVGLKNGWVTKNPASGIKLFREEPRAVYLSAEQAGALIAAVESHANTRAANVVRLLVYTGARRGEVLKARWEQFDLDASEWVKPSHHTKQRRTHRTLLAPQAVELLKAMRDAADPESPWVFPGDTKDGGPLTDIKRFWSDIRTKLGMPHVRLHDLRHTYASLAHAEGFSLPQIGELLGHTQAATTKRYAHLVDGVRRKAVTKIGVTLAKKTTAARDDRKVVPLSSAPSRRRKEGGI
jgi:integrase